MLISCVSHFFFIISVFWDLVSFCRLCLDYYSVKISWMPESRLASTLYAIKYTPESLVLLPTTPKFWVFQSVPAHMPNSWLVNVQSATDCVVPTHSWCIQHNSSGNISEDRVEELYEPVDQHVTHEIVSSVITASCAHEILTLWSSKFNWCDDNTR